MMDLYCHSFLIKKNETIFIAEGFEWGRKPNAIQWLLAGINGVRNAVRMAKAFQVNDSFVPKMGSEWEALIKESNLAIDSGDPANGKQQVLDIIEEQLLRLNTSMDYIQ
jgi:hypothetical protein